MGTHAARRRAAQRAIAVSAGTLVLCLGAAGPALASSAPAPTPLSGLVSGADPIPIPQPVSDAVQTVTDLAGLANPLAPTAAKHRHHRSAATPTKTQLTLGHQRTAPTSTRHATPARVARATPVTYPVGGLRGTPAYRMATPSGRSPAVANPAPVTRIVESAGQTALPALPAPPVQDTARILLIAVATMLMGGLASGHIKAAQQRTIA